MRYSANLLTFLSIIGVGSAAPDETNSSSSTTTTTSSLLVHTMKASPTPYEIDYHDGSKSPLIRVHMSGEDVSSPLIYEETLEGYTVGPSTKWKGKYSYLDVDLHTGDLFDTDLVAGIDDPSSKNINKHAATKGKKIKFEKDKKEKKNTKNRNLLRGGGQGEQESSLLLPSREEDNGTSPHRRTAITSGTLNNLVVPIRFSDHTSRSLPSQSDLEVLMNNEGPAVQCPTGSVRDVFLKSSFNQLDIQSTVVEWVTIDFTEAQCTGGNSGLSMENQQCLINALNKVVALGLVDFGNFDLDNDGVIDGIAFFHSGYAAEWGGIDAYGAGTPDRTYFLHLHVLHLIEI